MRYEIFNCSTSGRTFTLAEFREMSPVHPQDGRRPNFGQPVPLSPPLAELNEMVQYSINLYMVCLVGVLKL